MPLRITEDSYPDTELHPLLYTDTLLYE